MSTDTQALICKSVIAKYGSSEKQGLYLKGSQFKFFYALALAGLVAACDVNHEEEQTILYTVDVLERLNREMDSLKLVNDEMWNQVSQSIENALPADLPVSEKQNLLSVKNADLIQMFEAFDSLGDPLKNQIMEAGKSDQETAGKMRNIMTKVDELNKTLAQTFASLNKKDPVVADKLRLKISR